MIGIHDAILRFYWCFISLMVEIRKTELFVNKIVLVYFKNYNMIFSKLSQETCSKEEKKKKNIFHFETHRLYS